MHTLVVKAKSALSPRGRVEGMGLVEVERHVRAVTFASWFGAIGGFLLLVWNLIGSPSLLLLLSYMALVVVVTCCLCVWGAWHRAGLTQIDTEAEDFYKEYESDSVEEVERALNKEGASRLLRELVMQRIRARDDYLRSTSRLAG